jgi:hypothetical protein
VTSDFVASARTNARCGGRCGNACPLARGCPRRPREAMREPVRSRNAPLRESLLGLIWLVQHRCQRSPKESHPGSPIWSQCGDVTGPRSYRLPLFLLGSVAAAGAAGGDLLLSVFGPEALTGNLDEVRPVGQSIEGGRGQQGLAEQVGPFRPVPIRGQED